MSAPLMRGRVLRIIILPSFIMTPAISAATTNDRWVVSRPRST
jgi:hypothetical protein